MDQFGSCECGENTFHVQGKPLIRVICHCLICQQYNNAPYADIVMFLTKEVSLLNCHKVNYQTYRPPPAVQRGTCGNCNKPVIEFFRLPLFPKITIVPSENLTRKQGSLPEPSLHVFYHRRVSDANDCLPKYNGYLLSQLGLGVQLLKSVFAK